MAGTDETRTGDPMNTRGCAADQHRHETDSWGGDGFGALTDDNFGTMVSTGGARSLGRTGAVLSRKERLQVFGVDCIGPFGDGIVFKGGEWAPGGEYVQRLRVKNVSPKLKKLKYRLPTTKYFSMAYPEVITLSPGTMQEIDVVFRPLASEVYDDVILFKMLDGPSAGGFNVPVRALLPTLQVSIPEGLDFGYCQADDVSERIFYVKNTGEVPAPFSWEVPPPFTISPSTGVVAVGESTALICSLRPADASVFVSQAVLVVGQGVNAIKPSPVLEMKVSAVGKYCYVVPSEDNIDFGTQTIAAGGASASGDRAASCRKDFTLRNNSVVPAAFAIRRLEGDRDPAFSVYPSEGVIPPEDELRLTTTYHPAASGTFSRDHYEIVTVGGNKVAIGIQGRAVGCAVRLEKKEDPFARGCGVPDSINFREVKVGSTTSRVVYLYNQATEPCKFCFAVQGDSSIFKFSRTRGSIPSAGSEHPGEAQVTLTFTPNMPTNYYRRTFCLLDNQQPLVMDTMGTGYLVAKGEVQEQRPAPLRHAHVQAFRNRANVGLGRCSPEELEELLEKKGMSDLFARVGPQGTVPLQSCSVSNPLTRSGEATRSQTAVASEFFIDPADPVLNEVFFDRSVVDLGYVSGGVHETVTLTNNSNTEVHVVWNVKALESEKPAQGGGGLDINPLVAHVPAGGSLSFRVGLVPSKGNCYFAEEAEAFVSPSNQRTFRMVKDSLQQPPWCLVVRVLGHSFVGEQFLAKASLSTQHTGHRLCFPASHVGDTVFQTIRLSNQGNIPAYFSFKPDPSGIFGVKPTVGLIPAGDFQLCLLRFTPPGPGGYRHRLECVLNNNPGSRQEAELFGQGAVPAVQAICGVSEGGDGGGLVAFGDSSGWGSEYDGERDRRAVLYVRPTCVALVSTGTVKVKNSSRIPVIFSIEPPRASSGVLQVSPVAGLLLGNQSATVQVAFAPRETKGYRFKLPVKVRSILGDTPFLTDCRQLGGAFPAVLRPGTSVSVVGQGERGAVAFHPETLAFNVRLVNTPESKALVLENCSECDVKYKLFFIANKEPSVRARKASGGTGRRGNDGHTSQVTQPALRQLPQENGEAKGQGGPNKTAALFVDQPQGILPARSRTRTIATFRPVSEGGYDFSILCQVSAVDESNDSGPMTPIQADMAEQGHKARAAAAVLEGTGIMTGGGDTASTSTGMMPLRCGVTGRASFPTVVFQDVRVTREGGADVLGVSPRSLWSALSLSRINAMLSKPLSEEDVRFNQESSPDTSQLPRFDVPFVPSVIGHGPVIISLQICNPGFLPTAVTVSLPNAKPVEMETWANEGEPTAEELRQNDVIDRLKAFTLSPLPGTVIEVSAGETRPLRLAYSADSLSYGGIHTLPVLVRIKEGRQFWLDLRGSTLPTQTPMIYVPTGLAKEYKLDPVAVGTPLSEAPLQTTELLNVGQAEVSYMVEEDTVGDANEEQGHGVPVFRLEEAMGTIPGGGSAFLRWRFLPLEPKEYVLTVLVRTEPSLEENLDGQVLEITLRGRGYDPRERDPYREELPRPELGLVHPARQLEIPYGQPCVLGNERLRLGRLPQGAVLSRVLSVRNCLSNAAVEFSWDPSDSGQAAPLLSSGVLSIRPSKGTIEAGQTLLLQINISANCGPRMLGQRPIACLVREVLPTEQATRSRKPKSRLESRMEEERKARSRPPDPRVPVVSRPTAARTNHMAEVAKARSIAAGSIDTEGGRALVPHYPSSTLNPPVPRVLAEALEAGKERMDSATDLRTQSRGGTSRGESTRAGSPGGEWGAGGKAKVQRFGLSSAGDGSRTNSPGGKSCDRSSGFTRSWCSDRPVTAGGGVYLLRLEIEGEVVCAETFRTLFGRREELKCTKRIVHGANHGQSGDGQIAAHQNNVGDFHGTPTKPMESFLVPRPTEYVPDWAAFGNREAEETVINESGLWSDRRGPSREKASEADSTDDKVQRLRRAVEDPLVGRVTSRVLKRMVGDVVKSQEVRACFESLPSKPRKLRLEDIQTSRSLPDRLATALSHYLPSGAQPTPPLPPLTAAAAAVESSARTVVEDTSVSRNTLLDKDNVLTALKARSEVIVRGGGGERYFNSKTFANLERRVQAIRGEAITLANLVATLDNATVNSLERWLEQRECSRKQRGGVEDSNTPADAGHHADSVPADVATGGDGRQPTCVRSAEGRKSREDRAALTIQSHARRIKAVCDVEDAAEASLLNLVDRACQDPNTQRTVAAALEGTFFNLMQDAIDGEFNLSKVPRRFAIRRTAAKARNSAVDAKLLEGKDHLRKKDSAMTRTGAGSRNDETPLELLAVHPNSVQAIPSH